MTLIFFCFQPNPNKRKILPTDTDDDERKTSTRKSSSWFHSFENSNWILKLSTQPEKKRNSNYLYYYICKYGQKLYKNMTPRKNKNSLSQVDVVHFFETNPKTTKNHKETRKSKKWLVNSTTKKYWVHGHAVDAPKNTRTPCKMHDSPRLREQ